MIALFRRSSGVRGRAGLGAGGKWRLWCSGGGRAGWEVVIRKEPNHQAPWPLYPAPGFSRQKHWSGLPFPSPMRENEVAQSCQTLSDPMDCSLPGSSVHGIFQARVLEWGAIAFAAAPGSNQDSGPSPGFRAYPFLALWDRTLSGFSVSVSPWQLAHI